MNKNCVSDKEPGESSSLPPSYPSKKNNGMNEILEKISRLREENMQRCNPALSVSSSSSTHLNRTSPSPLSLNTPSTTLPQQRRGRGEGRNPALQVEDANGRGDFGQQEKPFSFISLNDNYVNKGKEKDQGEMISCSYTLWDRKKNEDVLLRDETKKTDNDAEKKGEAKGKLSPAGGVRTPSSRTGFFFKKPSSTSPPVLEDQGEEKKKEEEEKEDEAQNKQKKDKKSPWGLSLGSQNGGGSPKDKKKDQNAQRQNSSTSPSSPAVLLSPSSPNRLEKPGGLRTMAKSSSRLGLTGGGGETDLKKSSWSTLLRPFAKSASDLRGRDEQEEGEGGKNKKEGLAGVKKSPSRLGLPEKKTPHNLTKMSSSSSSRFFKKSPSRSLFGGEGERGNEKDSQEGGRQTPDFSSRKDMEKNDEENKMNKKKQPSRYAAIFKQRSFLSSLRESKGENDEDEKGKGGKKREEVEEQKAKEIQNENRAIRKDHEIDVNAPPRLIKNDPQPQAQLPYLIWPSSSSSLSLCSSSSFFHTTPGRTTSESHQGESESLGRRHCAPLVLTTRDSDRIVKASIAKRASDLGGMKRKDDRERDTRLSAVIRSSSCASRPLAPSVEEEYTATLERIRNYYKSERGRR